MKEVTLDQHFMEALPRVSTSARNALIGRQIYFDLVSAGVKISDIVLKIFPDAEFGELLRIEVGTQKILAEIDVFDRDVLTVSANLKIDYSAVVGPLTLIEPTNADLGNVRKMLSNLTYY